MIEAKYIFEAVGEEVKTFAAFSALGLYDLPIDRKSSHPVNGQAQFKNVVVINGDDLRGFHPQSDKILKMDDEKFAERTDPDSLLIA